MVQNNSSNYHTTEFNVLTGDANNLINNVSPSTSGYILTSNGTGAQPTFQANSGGGFTTPNSVVQLTDDFFSNINSGSSIQLLGDLTWSIPASVWTSTSFNADSSHPGVISHTALSSGEDYISLISQAPSSFVLGGGAITMSWVFNISALSTVTNRYKLKLGFLSIGASYDAAIDGVYFSYSDNVNSGNWGYNTTAASSTTTSNSSIAVTTGWHNATLTINAAGTSCSFTMDGVSLGTAISTNIPTAGIKPVFNIARTAGTIAQATIAIDLFSLTQNLTTPR